MSEILEHNQPLDRFRTRKRRDKPPGLLSWHHTRPLRTLRDILSEQGRVYRATVNGVLTPDEGAKLMAQTREIRSTLETIITVEAAAAEAAAANAPPPTSGNVTINILSVPEGYAASGEGANATFAPMPTIEHQPIPQADVEVQENCSDAKLLAELNTLTDAQLMERAIQCGLDPNLPGSSSSTSVD